MIYLHQKPAPIPVQFLYGPAKVALEAMIFLRIDSPVLSKWTLSENSSQDARMLLDACKALRNSRSREMYLDENISLEEGLRAFEGNVLHGLSYSTVLMLALMTWHFDASSSGASQGLITFLRQPHDNEVRRILQGRYSSIMRETAPSNFDFLLVLN